MGEIRSNGVVLHARDYREADRLITLLTRDAGKLAVIARGTKKMKSRFAALVEPLTLGHFLLHQGKGLATLLQGEIIRPYGSLRMDLTLYAYGQYFCELCDRCVHEGQPAAAIFTLLVASLELLEKETNPARLARCFELSLLDELGLRPFLDYCRHCGATTGPYRFDAAIGSLVCQSCLAGPESFPLSGAAVSTMRRFLEQGFHRLSVCSLPPTVSQEMLRAALGMLSTSLGVSQLKSLAFIKCLNEE